MQSAPICNTVAYYILEMCWGEVFLKNLTNFRMHLAWQKNLIIHKLINAHIAFGETQHFHLRTTFFKFFFFLSDWQVVFHCLYLNYAPHHQWVWLGVVRGVFYYTLIHAQHRCHGILFSLAHVYHCSNVKHWITGKNSAVFSHFQLLLHCSLKVQRFGLRGI